MAISITFSPLIRKSRFSLAIARSEDNGTAYMVMALVEGETLARRLTREQRLPPDAIARIVFPLLDGLEEVHGIGFLHRDIRL